MAAGLVRAEAAARAAERTGRERAGAAGSTAAEACGTRASPPAEAEVRAAVADLALGEAVPAVAGKVLDPAGEAEQGPGAVVAQDLGVAADSVRAEAVPEVVGRVVDQEAVTAPAEVAAARVAVLATAEKEAAPAAGAEQDSAEVAVKAPEAGVVLAALVVQAERASGAVAVQDLEGAAARVALAAVARAGPGMVGEVARAGEAEQDLAVVAVKAPEAAVALARVQEEGGLAADLVRVEVVPEAVPVVEADTDRVVAAAVLAEEQGQVPVVGQEVAALEEAPEVREELAVQAAEAGSPVNG